MPAVCERWGMIRSIPLLLHAQVFEPAMPSVSDTPWVERWITGSGFAGAGVMVALGIVAYLVLSKGSRARLAVPVAAGFWLLGAGVVGVGQWVVTPREQLRAAARELVAAAVDADRDTVASHLHADARVRTRYARAQGRERREEFWPGPLVEHGHGADPVVGAGPQGGPFAVLGQGRWGDHERGDRARCCKRSVHLKLPCVRTVRRAWTLPAS